MESNTKVTTALDTKGSLKKRPDLVYSITREESEAWETVQQADKLCCVQYHAKSAVARAGSARDAKTAGVGRSGQGSSAHSGDLKSRGSCWSRGKEGHPMAECTTKWKSGPRGGQQQTTAQFDGATSGQQSSFKQGLEQGVGSESHTSGKGA